jgi:DNA-binding protein H-NS
MEHHEQHRKLTHFEKETLMLLSELLTINQSIKGQLSKAEAEIIAKTAALQASIEALTAQLANAELTPEQAQSVTDVQAAAQALDDLNPDPVAQTIK